MLWGPSKPGGLDLSRSRHWQKVSLDTFKKLVLILSRQQYINQYFLVKIENYRDLSRFFRFLWISRLFLDLDREIIVFSKHLNQDFSSQHFLFTFLLQNWLQNEQKVWEIQNFCFKNAKNVIKVLTKIEKSQKVLKISISLKSLDNLD